MGQLSLLPCSDAPRAPFGVAKLCTPGTSLALRNQSHRQPTHHVLIKIQFLLISCYVTMLIIPGFGHYATATSHIPQTFELEAIDRLRSGRSKIRDVWSPDPWPPRMVVIVCVYLHELIIRVDENPNGLLFVFFFFLLNLEQVSWRWLGSASLSQYVMGCILLIIHNELEEVQLDFGPDHRPIKTPTNVAQSQYV